MSNTDELTSRVIETCPSFCAALTRDEVATFVSFTNVVEAEAKDIVAEIGNVEDHFFLVIGGVLKLSRDEAGNEIEVGRLDAGCLAGVMSFFDKQPRSIRLRAAKKGVTLLSITEPMYKRLCVEHSYIAVNLLEFIVLSLDKLVRSTSQEVSTMHKQMTGLGYR
ncbi:MAG TPA: cyclic nucleotide-binding domain-containing protein [Leucothrix mucor]|nr:cyclic nucleotide-binding domain-containing protein [Leucothrix mucor]